MLATVQKHTDHARRRAGVSHALSLAALGLVACIGCSHGVPEPRIVYEGHRGAPQAYVGALPRFAALSDDYEILGTVMVSCTRQRPQASHFVVALGTLDCSAERLTRVLEEQAAQVGGAALHRFLCQRMGERVECSANVVSTGQYEVKGAVVVRQRATAMARIEFQGEPGVVLGEAWSQATEQHYEPVSDRRLGRLKATVSVPSQLEDARWALFDAAAVLGGAHVIAPTCGDDLGAKTRSCTAVISTPRLDPRREALSSRWVRAE